MTALVYHRGDHAVGHTLLMQIDDFIGIQATIGASRVLDVIDDGIIANLGLGQLQDVRDAKGQIGLSRWGWCGGILR